MARTEDWNIGMMARMLQMIRPQPEREGVLKHPLEVVDPLSLAPALETCADYRFRPFDPFGP